MKKRIACLVLAMVMLIGIFPMSTLHVSADALTISEAGIKAIKEFQGFKKSAYLSGETYLIGYGTPSKKGATITEANADICLRDALKAVDAQISADAAAAHMNLVQKQHDALVWFGFLYGTGSVAADLAAYGAGITSSQAANVICTAGFEGGYPDTDSAKKTVQTRMVLANLYVNGVYSTTNKGSFAMTVFDAGNGDFGGAKKMVQVYDTKCTNEITVGTPSLLGKEFLGFYSKNADKTYALVTGLNSATANKVLYARWQEGDTKVKASYTVPAEVLYRAANIPTDKQLEVFDKVDGTTKIDFVKRNSSVTVVAEQLSAGVKWVELKNTGWVKLGLLSEIKPIVPAVTVTVVDDFVNIRDDASVTANKVGIAKRGETLTVYMTDDLTTNEWGYVGNGWVCLMYTDYMSKAEQSTTKPSETAQTQYTGTVSCGSVLNVRQSASAGAARVGTINNGSKVEITELTTVLGHQWGKLTSGGWVCMDYVRLDSAPATESATTGTVISSSSPCEAIVSSTVSLNVRATAGGDKVTSLAPGSAVTITETTNVGGVTWGHIAQGWINMSYVVVRSNGNTTYSVGGTIVNCSKAANVRVAAGTTNALVGVAALGSRVTVTDKTSVKGFTWYKTEKGWICGDYVRLDAAFDPPKSEEKNDKPETVIDSDVTASASEGYPAVTNTSVELYDSVSSKNVLLTISNNTDINILERSMYSGKVYGKVVIGTSTGWVDLDKVTLKTVNAVVTASSVACYEKPNRRATTEHAIMKGSDVVIIEQSFDGTTLWGKVDYSGRELWIDMSGISMYAGNQKPAGIFTQNGVGYLTGSINKNSVEIKKNENGQPGAAMDYKLVKGYRVNVTSRMYNTATTETWGKIVFNNTACWVNMSNVDLDSIVLKTTQSVEAYTDYTGTSKADTLAKDATLTLLERKIQPFGTGINDWGKVYVNDNPADIRCIVLDEGKLTVKTSTPTNSTTTPDVLATISVTTRAKNPANLYEEASTGSKVLLEIKQNTIVTVQNWRNVGADTWCKVKVGNLIGWVLKTDLNVDTLSGSVKVDSLKLYAKPDVDSTAEVYQIKSQRVAITEVRYVGEILWGKTTVATHSGWVNVAQITLDVPTDSTSPEAVIASGALNSVSSNVTVYADFGVTAGAITLPMGTKVNLVDVKMSGSKAWWKADLGSNDGWIDQEYITFNPVTAAVVGASSIEIYNDLANKSKVVETAYTGEKVTVNSFKVYTGELYANVTMNGKTGWMLILSASNECYVSMVPGAVNTDPQNNNTTPTNPTTPTTPTNPTTVTKAGYIVCRTTVNVREKADVSSALVTTLKNGTVVNVDQETTVNGYTWVHTEYGWIYGEYVQYGSNTSSTSSATPSIMTKIPAGAIATGFANQDLAVRAGTNPGHKEVGKVKENNSIVIYEVVIEGNMVWARIAEDQQWVCLTYVTVTAIGGSEAGSMGTVGKAAFTVNIRRSANSNSDCLGKVMITSPVKITETKGVGNETWGKTALGWINMDYVIMDSNNAASTAPSTSEVG